MSLTPLWSRTRWVSRSRRRRSCASRRTCTRCQRFCTSRERLSGGRREGTAVDRRRTAGGPRSPWRRPTHRVGVTVALIKFPGGALSLALVQPWGCRLPQRLLTAAPIAGGAVLTVYGWLLVVGRARAGRCLRPAAAGGHDRVALARIGLGSVVPLRRREVYGAAPATAAHRHRCPPPHPDPGGDQPRLQTAQSPRNAMQHATSHTTPWDAIRARHTEGMCPYRAFS
jgi:hypothetical protein